MFHAEGGDHARHDGVSCLCHRYESGNLGFCLREFPYPKQITVGISGEKCDSDGTALLHLHLAEVHPHGCHVLPSGHGEEEGAGDADAFVGILGRKILIGKRFKHLPIRHNHKLRLFRLTATFNKILNIFFIKMLAHIDFLVRLEDKGNHRAFAGLAVAVHFLHFVAVIGDKVEVEGAFDGGLGRCGLCA